MYVGDYVQLQYLPREEGGGWAISVPDLRGCMSDGETFEEAVVNVQDAIARWIDAARRLGGDVPQSAHGHPSRSRTAVSRSRDGPGGSKNDPPTTLPAFQTGREARSRQQYSC